LVLLAGAPVAAVLGFTGMAARAVTIAKFLFFLFLVVFLITLIAGLFRRQPRT